MTDYSSLDVKVSTDMRQDELQDAVFAVRFSCKPPDFDIATLVNIPTPSLFSAQIFEQWQGFIITQSGDWQLFQNQQYLIAVVPAQGLTDLTIEQATETAYSQLFTQMENCGYPYLLRTWNYFPHITNEQQGHNNYQLFCSGRARAYQSHALPEQSYPAATVVGTQQAGLFVYFIAAKKAGIGVENPQQISAFHYPSAYSESPPLFSRALLHRNAQQEIFFISGTASITGHSTRHEDNAERQLHVCLENIRHLMITAANNHQLRSTQLSDLTQLKVYIKHKQDFAAVYAYLQKVFTSDTDIFYLQGDMCRSDLLVEIEALAIS